MRSRYDFKENRLKKINTRFEFDETIYVDRFMYENCEKYQKFSQSMEAMHWNRARLESNRSSYYDKNVLLTEYLTKSKEILLSQTNKDDQSDCMIPDENDKFEIITPDSVGMNGISQDHISITIDTLSEIESRIRK